MKHDKLVKDVEDALAKLFADTSVSREQTKDSLEQIQEWVTEFLSALESI
jgi:hypothetical protein